MAVGVVTAPSPGEIEADSLVRVFLHQLLQERDSVNFHEQVDSLAL